MQANDCGLQTHVQKDSAWIRGASWEAKVWREVEGHIEECVVDTTMGAPEFVVG